MCTVFLYTPESWHKPCPTALYKYDLSGGTLGSVRSHYFCVFSLLRGPPQKDFSIIDFLIQAVRSGGQEIGKNKVPLGAACPGIGARCGMWGEGQRSIGRHLNFGLLLFLGWVLSCAGVNVKQLTWPLYLTPAELCTPVVTTQKSLLGAKLEGGLTRGPLEVK